MLPGVSAYAPSPTAMGRAAGGRSWGNCARLSRDGQRTRPIGEQRIYPGHHLETGAPGVIRTFPGADFLAAPSLVALARHSAEPLSVALIEQMVAREAPRAERPLEKLATSRG